MPIPAIIPVAITLFGLFDLGLFATSGKDTIEHLTGVDVVGSVIDYFWPSAQQDPNVPTYGDVVAGSIADISSMLTVAIGVIIIVCALMIVKRRFA
jgi:hypothetical protein